MHAAAYELRRIPALPFALALLAGIGTALYVDLKSGALAIVGTGLFVLCLALLWKGNVRTWSVVLTLTLFALLGALRATEAIDRDHRRQFELLAASDEPVEVIGRIDQSASAAPDGDAVLLRRALLTRDSFRLSTGRLRVRVRADSGTLAVLRYGDMLCAKGRLRSFSETALLSGGAAVQMIARGEAGTLFTDSAGLVVYPRRGYFIPRTVERWHTAIASAFHRQLSLDAAALCTAMLLGDRGDFSDAFSDRLRLTGLSHLFALSGMNVGLLAGFVWFSLGLFYIPRVPRLWLLLAVVLLYMELGREAPSLVRASLMAVLFILGHLLYRKAEIGNVVAAAAFLELLWRPLHLLDAGFLLSYLAVLGLITSFDYLRNWLWRVLRKPQSRLTNAGLDLAAASVAAQIGTLPQVGFLFHRVPVAGILGNLIAVPAFGFLLILSLIFLLTTAIAPPLAVPLAHALDAVSYLLGRGVNALAAIPLAGTPVGELPWWLIVALYAAIGLLCAGFLAARSHWILAAVLLLANLTLWSSLLVPPAAPCTISFLSVSNGDAMLISSRDGRAVLVDAGPSFDGWTAADRIGPFLRERGVRTLDALILTHPDGDHIGGAPAMLSRVPVKHLYTNGDTSASRGYTELMLAANASHLTPVTLEAGQALRLSRDVLLTVLSSAATRSRLDASDNARSLALRLDCDGSSALLVADIDSATETALAGWDQRLDADLLKVSHHGSRSATSAEFLARVSPQIAVISSGRRNIYGHPHPTVVARLVAAHCEIHYTAREGHITFEARNGGWRYSPSAAQRLLKQWKLPHA